MKVFISHAAADAGLARQLAEVLEQAGMEVWYDQQVLPGQNWAAEIGKALESSEAMVVLVTPAALASDHVHHALTFALGHKAYHGRVIPVLVEPEGTLPKDDFPWILQKFEGVELSKYRQPRRGLRRVAKLLEDAGSVGV